MTSTRKRKTSPVTSDEKAASVRGTDPDGMPEAKKRRKGAKKVASSGASGECQPPAVNAPTEFECPICLNTDDQGETKRLPCSHEYHKTCINKWLAESRRCPLCRKSTVRASVQKPLKNRRPPANRR
ncbi:hypothetical protein AVEN_44373-1 [Araneus ventricosus]|uniref:RING-type E3 ubiquitin transferase n=1 Tax=Araneus ventricosus TaxID=182803 RepID=A0A4Y2QRM3_ARAVE|nr:hypothetical protein AVEN_44373-1 [Araneus ventricosus]